MSTFRNVSSDDRDVQVDGLRFHVPASESFTIADAHDDSLAEQPFFELVKKPKKDEESSAVVSYGGAEADVAVSPEPTPEIAAEAAPTEGAL